MSTEILFHSLLKRLRANDLQGFKNLLTDPLAAQALDYNEGVVFKLACENKNIEFARATLSQTLPQHVGKQLPYCVRSRNIELFTTLVHLHPAIFDHFPDGLLHYLSALCVGAPKDPEPPYIARDIMTVLLNAAPEIFIQQQLEQMHKFNPKDEVLVFVNEAWGQQQIQRQKNRLAQEIEDHGHVGRARKI